LPPIAPASRDVIRRGNLVVKSVLLAQFSSATIQWLHSNAGERGFLLLIEISSVIRVDLNRLLRCHGNVKFLSGDVETLLLASLEAVHDAHKAGATNNNANDEGNDDAGVHDVVHCLVRVQQVFDLLDLLIGQGLLT